MLFKASSIEGFSVAESEFFVCFMFRKSFDLNQTSVYSQTCFLFNSIVVTQVTEITFHFIIIPKYFVYLE